MLATWGTSTGFNPASLFSGGEQGAWYDPSDNTTMFQDAAGTTPVTAVEQAVGCILDKSVPVAQTGYYSAAFDGTSGGLLIADNAAFAVGSNNFTAEAWAYPTTSNTQQTIIGQWSGATGGTGLSWILITSNDANRYLRFSLSTNGSSVLTDVVSTASLTLNAWNHVALVRNGSVFTAYLNGVSVATYTIVAGTALFDATNQVSIGATSNLGLRFTGFISNARFVNGTAVYTGNFTPPTAPLTAISGTALLTCQNNRFIDNSSNAFTLTVNGNPGVNLFNPFNSTPARMVNNAYQTTSASRPTLRARYNLLTYSEDFGNAAWGQFRVGVSTNAIVAPDGTTTADTLTATASTGTHVIEQSSITPIAGVSYTASIYVKKNTSQYISFGWYNNPSNAAGFGVDLNNQSITGSGAIGTSYAISNTAIQNVGDGWLRITAQVTGAAILQAPAIFLRSTAYTGGAGTFFGESFVAAGTESVYIWGAQLVPTAVFPSNTYQRIAAATDYATGPQFPQYLAFDGTDDSLLTANVDFATVTSDGQARRNLLLAPTLFDSTAAWSVFGSTTVAANQTTAPDGTTTADRLTCAAATSLQGIGTTTGFTSLATTYTASWYVKQSAGVRYVQLFWNSAASATSYANFDLQLGTVTAGTYTAAVITDVGNGWWRISVASLLAAVAASGANMYIAFINAGTDARGTSYVGNGTDDVFIWGAQLETGSTATAFQNIGTDKMTVWSGLSKLSDAAAGTVVELSASSGSANNGSFMLSSAGQASAGAKYGSTLRGTSLIYSDTPASYASPISNVITLQSDIDLATAALEQTMRINASNVTLTTVGANAGVGNFGTYPLFIGRRNNANFPFNGRIYSLIVRGAASNSSQVAQTERYVASKTPLGVVP